MRTALLATVCMALGLALAFALGEAFLRWIYAPESVRLRVQMNRLATTPDNFQARFDGRNVRFVPNSHGQMVHPEYHMAVSHDGYGFRNPCPPSKVDIPRVMLVGDSFVYGIGVDDPNTFSCHLNQGEKVNFYTLGLPGASPADYLHLLKMHSAALENTIQVDKSKPVYVMLTLPNDFEGLLALADPAAPPHEPAQAIPSPGSLGRRLNDVVTVGMLSNSYLAQAVKLALLNLQLFRKRDAGQGYYVNYAGSTFYTHDVPLATDRARNALRRFRNQVQLLGYASVVFILVPDPADIDPLRLQRDASIGRFDAARINPNFKMDSLIEACSDLDIQCLDVRPALTNPSPDRMNPNFYVSDGHLNAKGVAAVSRHILSTLETTRDLLN